MAKRLELLSDLVPQARLIALLVNANNPVAERIIQDVHEAARAKGLQLSILSRTSRNQTGDFERAPPSAVRAIFG